MSSRLFAIALLGAFFSSTLFAEEPEDPSISEETVQGPAVQFQNRTNRRATPAARQAERNLGSGLAENVLTEGEGTQRGVSFRRVFDPAEEGFGADIMSIDQAADFGHINAVARVLSGYLTKSFEYSQADADVLARYILYYNARIRQNTVDPKESYSPKVLSQVNAEELGIGRSYTQWSGNTQILIPLRKNVVRPGDSDVDRTEITDNTEGEMDPSDEKKMEEIEEKRDEEDKTELEEKKEELQKEKEVIKQEQEDTGKKLEELRKDPEKNAEEIVEEEKKQEELAKKEEEINEQIEEVEKQEEETAGGDESTRQEETAEESGGDTASNNTDSSSEETTNTTDESTNTGDTATTTTDSSNTTADKPLEEIEKGEDVSENVVAEKILFLRVLKYIEGGHYSNEMWQIDPKNDDALNRGPYTNICGKEFKALNDEGVIVIGYKGSAHDDTAHHLTLLDAESLVMKKQSKEEVFWRTPMIAQDNKLYVIQSKDKKYYLARFNQDLTLDASSSNAISPNSDVTFYGEKIYLTGKSGTGEQTTITVLNKADLKVIKVIDSSKLTSR